MYIVCQNSHTLTQQLAGFVGTTLGFTGMLAVPGAGIRSVAVCAISSDAAASRRGFLTFAAGFRALRSHVLRVCNVTGSSFQCDQRMQ